MKLELIGGLIFVPVTVEDAGSAVDLRAIIDTGSAGTAFEISKFRIDFSRSSRIADMVGIGGEQPVLIQTVDAVRLGDLRVPDWKAELADLENPFGIEAIIGGDILSCFGAVIDYAHQEAGFRH